MELKMDRLTLRRTALRYIFFLGGLFVVANGIVMTINANLGVNPWDVFHIGMANITGLSIGRVIQATSLILIVISYFSKVRIYIGTVLNMIFLGLFVDLIIAWGYCPNPEGVWLRIILYMLGVISFGLGIAIYIKPNLGAGPRDSLMLAITRATGFKMGTVRTMMEVVIAIVGYLLGGPLGVGTVIFALTLGFFMEIGFYVVNRLLGTALFKYLWFERSQAG